MFNKIIDITIFNFVAIWSGSENINNCKINNIIFYFNCLAS